jgi:integrase
MSVRARTMRDGARRFEVRWTDEDGHKRGQVFDRKGDADSFDLDRRRQRQMSRLGHAAPPKPPDRVTVDEWLDRWLTSPDRPIRASTRRQRTNILDKWVRPYIGDEQLAALSRPRLVAWRERILTDEAGAVNANRAKSALSVALTDACERGLIEANPALGWRALPEPEPGTRALTVAEVEAIRAQMSTAEDKAVISVLAYLGLRPEELAGLTWSSLPAKRHRLTVSRTIVNGNPGPTKTRKPRTVPIPEPVRDDLKQLRRTTPTGYVFAQKDGRPWSLDRWRKKVWRPARLRAAVEPCRIYDLRHSAATAAIYDGEPLHVVHARMGHASVLTTLARYTHVQEEAQLDEKRPPLAEQIRRERARAERRAAEPQRIDRLADALRQRAGASEP